MAGDPMTTAQTETFLVRLQRSTGGRWTATLMANSAEEAARNALADARLHTPDAEVVRVSRKPARYSNHPRR